MGTRERVEETKGNGIKVRCPLNGSGTEDDPYRPAVFDNWEGEYYHLESIDYAAGEAVVWLNKGRSSQSAVDAFRTPENPITEVLKET